jgi:CRP-like cAMP-binding protein
MGAPVQLLRRVRIFESLDERDLEQLAERFQQRTYDRGSPVVSAGSRGLGFFVVGEGEATVRVRGEVARRLGPGDCFGEVALIDGGKRSADIVAESHLHCYGISRDVFRPYVQEHPDVAWALLEELAAKLRKAQPSGDGGGGVTARLGLRRRR